MPTPHMPPAHPFDDDKLREECGVFAVSTPHGEGVAQDYREAANWYRRAAMQKLELLVGKYLGK